MERANIDPFQSHDTLAIPVKEESVDRNLAIKQTNSQKSQECGYLVKIVGVVAIYENSFEIGNDPYRFNSRNKNLR